MNEFYAWKPEYLEPVTGIAASAIGFIIYWFLALSPKIKASFFAKYDAETAWIRFVFFQKMAGVVFCGIVPAITVLCLLPYSLADYGLKPGDWMMSLKWGGIMCILIFIINYFATKNPENLKNYPQMRVMHWHGKRILINSFAWTAYLLAYEFMFRGILLISCYHALGFWPAVAVNLSLYSATHIPKGLNETIGAIPYGLLLCYVTIASGSIAVSFITHLALALSNDYFSVHHSREMKFIR
jgi:membrane protease YdiL (CAAX protease family)